MITITSTINPPVNLFALQTAARTQFGSVYIDSNNTDFGTTWTVYLSNTVANAAAQWDAIMQGHDAVFISADKTQITADDTDFATITVKAPKPGAASVRLLVNGTPVPVSLVAGAGIIQLTSKDAGSIVVSVENPANRCLDSITIIAQ